MQLLDGDRPPLRVPLRVGQTADRELGREQEVHSPTDTAVRDVPQIRGFCEGFDRQLHCGDKHGYQRTMRSIRLVPRR
ncbi:hypothetical protein GCM10017772_31170 [Promicromonospora soli]|uniref:Uncharacterized protein n=1 Tax=Promicromonospora soli TaxID=2035533 RepID=A0A919G0H2_9MICO|nr:hypothetical protein GCM10017772_31170 [Promicromonospora soli]